MTSQEMCAHYASRIGQQVQFVTEQIDFEFNGLYGWKKGQLSYVDGVIKSGSNIDVLFTTNDPSDLIQLPLEQVSQHVQFV